MIVSPVTGSLIANVEFDTVFFSYTGSSTLPDTATFILHGRVQCVVAYAYDTAGRVIQEQRT